MQMKPLIIIFFSVFMLPCTALNGNFYYQSPKKLYKAKGKASYYADKFNNRKTTSGERFCNDSLTAAHKFLPFGTKVKVINVHNDSMVVVRINDRLPKKSSRIIDLSKAAARQLNFIKSGVTQVSVEQLIK